MKLVAKCSVAMMLAASLASCSVAQGKRGAVFFGFVPLAGGRGFDSSRAASPIENPLPPQTVNPWTEPAATPVAPPTTASSEATEARHSTPAHVDPTQFTIATLIAAAFGVMPGIGLFGDW